MTTTEIDNTLHPYDTRIEDGCFITFLAFISLIVCIGGTCIIWAIITVIKSILNQQL